MPSVARRNLAALAGACALLLSAHALGAAVVPQPARDEFQFVVLGDSQFHEPAVFNRMIDDVRHLNPGFVIQVGDMIEGYAPIDVVAAQWERFGSQIAPLGTIPFVPVPGNHDLYNPERRADTALEDLYQRRWGPTYRAFEYRNARFFVLNSDAPGEERSIGPDQWRWLADELAGTTAEHVFVFMHRPPATLANAEALHDLLRRHRVRYVFYGHHHHYHFFERDGIRYVMTNAAATSAVPLDAVGGYHHFLLVSVRDAEVRYAVVRADAIEPPDSSHPDDNQALFDLTRQLVAAQQPMTSLPDGGWSLQIPLKNPTPRPLAAYVSCRSDDDRWRFEPAAIPAAQLPSGGEQTLALTARYAVGGTPETRPTCAIQVPWQTRAGEWIPFERETRGVLPEDAGAPPAGAVSPTAGR
jgi:predicted phosphodiesterase